MSRRLKDLTIPNPCRSSWGEMDGADQQRFCSSCQKTVHDLSAMTRRDANKLLRNGPAELCVRITRDADGKIIHRPGTRLGRGLLASASFFGISALASPPAFAQNSPAACVAVKVVDPGGAPISRATVSLSNQSGITSGITNDEGVFRTATAPGRYDLTLESPGFRKAIVQSVDVSCDKPEPPMLNVQLSIGEILMGGPMFAEPVPVHQKAATIMRKLFRRP